MYLSFFFINRLIVMSFYFSMSQNCAWPFLRKFSQTRRFLCSFICLRISTWIFHLSRCHLTTCRKDLIHFLSERSGSSATLLLPIEVDLCGPYIYQQYLLRDNWIIGIIQNIPPFPIFSCPVQGTMQTVLSQLIPELKATGRTLPIPSVLTLDHKWGRYLQPSQN